MRNKRFSVVNEERYERGRKLLGAAFAALRKQKLIALQNHKCCMGCATSALGQRAKEENLERPGSVLGVVYYHSQDADGLRDCGECYIGFSATEGSPLSDEALGAAVRDALVAQGLEVEWNGKADTRVCVRL